MRRGLDLRKAFSKVGLGVLLCSLGVIILFNALGVQSGPTVVIEVTEDEDVVIRQEEPVFDPAVVVVPVILVACGAVLGVVGGMQYRKERQGTADSDAVHPETPQTEGETLLPETAQKKREELARLLEAGLLTKEEYRERLNKLE